METHTRIFLTGFMGSGKSTVGPLLASQLGLRFLDLDALVESREQRPVQEIFERKGEQHFRAVEAETLADAARIDRAVIALGGGAFASHENRAVVKGAGVSVWLDPPVDELAARLHRSTVRRPLIEDAGQRLVGDALVARISRLLGDRRASYELADIAYRPAPGSTPEYNAEQIAILVGEHAS